MPCAKCTELMKPNEYGDAWLISTSKGRPQFDARDFSKYIVQGGLEYMHNFYVQKHGDMFKNL